MLSARQLCHVYVGLVARFICYYEVETIARLTQCIHMLHLIPTVSHMIKQITR